jgi:N6-adenosine-specific RNA methylase IME4
MHDCELLFSFFRIVDLDVRSSVGSTKKPEDMYRIIEHFALGRRRLELFGEDHNIRPGWLTLGKNLSYSNFNKEVHNNIS